MSRHRSSRSPRRRDGRPGGPVPQSPTLPGTLGQHLHDIGAGRRPMPTSGAIRHHYIAQMLLREFLDPTQPRERLWQLDKYTGEIVPQTTEAAASVRRLYRVQAEDGSESDQLEGFFSMVEGHAAGSLCRLRADPTVLDEGDRANISLLLALQDARTPAGHRRRLAQFSAFARSWAVIPLSDAAKVNARYLTQHPESTIEEAEAARLEALRDLRDGKLLVEVPDELARRTMLETWLEMAGVIHGLCWKLLFARDSEFVLGDRPMVMHDPSPKFPFSGNGLVSSPTSYTLMPLGPALCLRLDQVGDGLVRRNARRQVALVNLRSYGWAKRFVYARTRDVLEALHGYAVAHPDEVPAPRPDPQVFVEEADPDDPAVGAEHPAGYPKGIWYDEPGQRPRFMAYKLQYIEDPRSVIIDDKIVGPDDDGQTEIGDRRSATGGSATGAGVAS